MSASEEVNAVVDKVADKVGLAFEEVKPLAEKVIQEYGAQALAGAIACGLLAALFAFVAYRLFTMVTGPWRGDSEVRAGVGIVGCVLACVGFAVTIGLTIGFALEASAPTYYCLREILKASS